MLSRNSGWMLVGLMVLGSALDSASAAAQAREFRVTRARVNFKSEAPLETINGVNNDATGSVSLDPSNLSGASGTITVPVASFRTGIDLRDEHLRGSDWLDAENHPNATFEITGIRGGSSLTADEDARLQVTGRFTMHGVTRDVTARVRAKWDGSSGLRARAQFTIRLDQFNVSINPAVRLKVSNEIQITIDIRASA
ncbi:MAG: YceI family protein [Myxococcota bacterium]